MWGKRSEEIVGRKSEILPLYERIFDLHRNGIYAKHCRRAKKAIMAEIREPFY